MNPGETAIPAASTVFFAASAGAFTKTVLIFWLGAVGVATTKFGYSIPQKAIPYFGAIVCTVFVTDVIKAKLADRLRLLLTARFVRNLNIILGIVLLIFGGRLIMVARHLAVL